MMFSGHIPIEPKSSPRDRRGGRRPSKGKLHTSIENAGLERYKRYKRSNSIEDLNAAATLLKNAANTGKPRAQTAFASIIFETEYKSSDEEKKLARKYLQDACESKHAQALYNMGCYIDMGHIESTDEKAIFYLNSAMEFAPSRRKDRVRQKINKIEKRVRFLDKWWQALLDNNKTVDEHEMEYLTTSCKKSIISRLTALQGDDYGNLIALLRSILNNHTHVLHSILDSNDIIALRAHADSLYQQRLILCGAATSQTGFLKPRCNEFGSALIRASKMEHCDPKIWLHLLTYLQGSQPGFPCDTDAKPSSPTR